MELTELLSHPVVSLAEVFVVGAGLLTAFGIDLRRLGLRGVALAWVTGALTVATVVLIAGFGGSFHASRLAVGVMAIALVVVCLLKRAPRVDKPAHTHRLPGMALSFTVALMVGWVLFGCARSLDRPLVGDEIHIWWGRARLALQLGGFGPSYSEAVGGSGFLIAAPDYPPLNPLLQIWMSIDRELSGTIMRWPIQMFDIMAILFLAGRLKESVHPGAASLLLAGTFLTSTYALPSSYSDRMVALGVLMAVDGASTVLSGRADQRWISLPIGLALMVASKHEGSALSLVVLLAIGTTMLLARPRPRIGGAATLRLVTAFSLAAAIVAAIWAWNHALGLGNDLLELSPAAGSTGFSARLDRAVTVAGRFFSDFALVPSASGLLLILAVVLSVVRGSIGREVAILVPAATAVGGSVMFLLVYVFTPHNLLWQWESSGSRVLGDLNLVAATWAGAVLGTIVPPPPAPPPQQA